jgi:hypothetical protein
VATQKAYGGNLRFWQVLGDKKLCTWTLDQDKGDGSSPRPPQSDAVEDIPSNGGSRSLAVFLHLGSIRSKHSCWTRYHNHSLGSTDAHVANSRVTNENRGSG